MRPPTRKIGILGINGSLSLARWQEWTVAGYAELNPDFIYFFLDEEDGV